ncbi:glycosyltransferase family 2 protein [Salinimicrobium sp. CAU 1759]
MTKEFELPTLASAEKFSTNKNIQSNDASPEATASENYRKATFTKRHIFTLVSTFLLLIGGAVSVYLLQPQFEEMNLSRINTIGGTILLVLTGFLLMFRLGFLAYITQLFFRYKPVTSVTDEELPTCTVIVPAYNEGKQVYSTLLSLTNSLYPEEKLQLIAIDDGSKDDTWEWMKKAKEQLGDRVAIYQQPHNQGKRHALYRGFNLATGEVFVTVDSDSIVEKDTLRNLVSPFVTNENCGAVAGNVRVLNNERAIIPRMLNVSFVFSFEFIRSAQSVLGSVLCTPGALAAYRSKAVMTCLPEWINQTFMGQPTDIGEDRAMTNMILKQGYHVLFQRNAYVLTNIPEKFSSLHKMFTRWERSNVRENLMMTKFAFKPFRNGSRSGTRLLLLNQWMHMLTAYPLFLIMIVLLVMHPVLFLSSTLLSILIFSSLPAFFYAKKYNISEAFWAYSYSLFYTFGLFWITPYAMATANRRGWLTRELPVKK